MSRQVSRYAFTIAAGALLVAFAACSRTSPSPTSPTNPATAADNAGGSTTGMLKTTAPTPIAPVNDQVVASSSTVGPTLSAMPVSTQYVSATVQYRFRVFDAGGAAIQDSGAVAAPSWTIPVAMTPNKRFTWIVRAEYQGAPGPWSATASFVTPDPPPAYNRFIGNWQGCGAIAKKSALVGCVANAVLPNDSVSDMEVVKRVAWLLRSEGAGLLIKSGGDNTVLWQGYSFSASRICYPDGHIYKILGDAGPHGANTPGWDDNGFVDPTLYVSAIDPAKP